MSEATSKSVTEMQGADQIEQWKLTIRPTRGLLSIDLPELWRYRDLISLFVRRDIVAKFKQTILGPLWFVIGPLLSTFVYALVFNRIAGIETGGAPPVLFYMSGIVSWSYFAACLNGTSSTFTSNAHIFGKVYFPRLVTPISTVISNLLQFGIQFGLLLALIAWFAWSGHLLQFNWTVLLIPLYLALLAGVALGVGILISSATTKYRDLTQLLGVGVQLWMYATPIIYPVSKVPEKYRWVVELNPVAPLIHNFRYAVIGTEEFHRDGLFYSLAFAVVVSTMGILVFNKVEQSFMDTV